MPVTERQRRWAFAVKGEAWARAHHFDKVQRKKRRKAVLDRLKGRR